MLSHKSKIYLAITVILVAVILLVVGFVNIFSSKDLDTPGQEPEQNTKEEFVVRHPLTGLALDDKEFSCLPVSIMVENAADVLPQKGLDRADVIYESLAEGNITRLMAVYDSTKSVDQIGPVRSARPYFIDWAEEYGGIYMHVGGSPQALKTIDDYDLIDVDQIGAGEVYFWRDQNLNAPHNVFTSNSNWLRAAEIRGGDEYYCRVGGIGVWNFVDLPEEGLSEEVYHPEKVTVDFSSDLYQVEWKYNPNINAYQRWQGGEKFIYHTGEQATAQNVIVQLANTKIIDDLGRRKIDTQAGGSAYIFNAHGLQIASWKFENGRTRFYLSADHKEKMGQEVELVPGKTWVEIISDEQDISYE